MSEKYKERHMFPGGNTPEGFCSYYDYIIDRNTAKRVYVLKGGPGVGKSSYMKKVAKAVIGNTDKIEFLHCSSDPQSLDGVVIPSAGIAMIDGTSPHIVDPVYPAAVDEIINLGEFWDKKGIEEHKDEIISTQYNIKYEYQRAYKYLKAAELIDDDTNSMLSEATDDRELNEITHRLIDSVFGGKEKGVLTSVRKMFANAITPAGLINYSDTVLYDCKHVYAIECPSTMDSFVAADRIMNKLLAEAMSRSYHIEAFYCPMKPKTRIEHMVIPEISAGITVLNKYNTDETVATDIVDLSTAVNKAKLRAVSGKIDENAEIMQKLLQNAQAALKNAYWLHNTLESYYVPNIDFDGVNMMSDKTISEIRQALDNQ